MLTDTRLGRYVLWNEPTDRDHLRFPSAPLRAARRAADLPMAPRRFGPVTVNDPQGPRDVAVDSLLAETGTTALVVVSGGRIVLEWYAPGARRDLPGRNFSVTKSFASALVGAAIADGAIAGLETRVDDHLPEFAGSGIGGLSLRHLLEMRSGIRFVEGPLPWSDDAICYFSPDCRAATRRARIVDPVGTQFHYNDYHPFLVGMMLERATGEPIAAYAERRLWQRIGAEYPASLSLDSAAHGFAHLESGLNATAVDLARFGLMILRGGKVGEDQVLPEDWVRQSTGPEGARRDPDWFSRYQGKPWGRVFVSGRYFYKLFWWGHEVAPGDCDCFAMGVLGAHIHVSPRLDTVIVRQSGRFPKGMWWPPVFRQLAEQAAEHAQGAA